MAKTATLVRQPTGISREITKLKIPSFFLPQTKKTTSSPSPTARRYWEEASRAFLFRKINKKNLTIGRSSKSYGRTYFAARDFEKGGVVVHIYGRIIDHQTKRISVQIGMRRHILPTKWSGGYLNHSCEPNTYVRTEADGHPVLIAHCAIKMGEEITFAYYMTEYAWAPYTDETHVVCKCGSKKCDGKILSFSQLSPMKQKKLVNSGLVSAYLADHVSKG